MVAPAPDQRDLIERGIANGNLSEVCKQFGLVPQTKWILFGRALSLSPPELRDIEIDPGYMTDRPALQPDNAATHVVFVIYGIRDHGFWTQKIARVIKKEADKDNARKEGTMPAMKRASATTFAHSPAVMATLPWSRSCCPGSAAGNPNG